MLFLAIIATVLPICSAVSFVSTGQQNGRCGGKQLFRVQASSARKCAEKCDETPSCRYFGWWSPGYNGAGKDDCRGWDTCEGGLVALNSGYYNTIYEIKRPLSFDMMRQKDGRCTGTQLFKVKASSPLKCAEKCDETPSCRYFGWWSPGYNGAGKDDCRGWDTCEGGLVALHPGYYNTIYEMTTTTTTTTTTKAPRPLSFDMMDQQNGMCRGKTLFKVQASSPRKCAEKCDETPSCRYFGWWYPGHNGAGMDECRGWDTCEGGLVALHAGYENAIWQMIPTTPFSVSFVSTGQQNGMCRGKQLFWFDGWPSEQRLSLAQCAEKCDETPSCRYFAWWSPGYGGAGMDGCRGWDTCEGSLVALHSGYYNTIYQMTIRRRLLRRAAPVV